MDKIRIESIKLEYFRGIRRGEIGGFSDVNIFVGPNNSGKSSILFSIYLMAGLLADRRKEFPRYTQYDVEKYGDWDLVGIRMGHRVILESKISRKFFYRYRSEKPLRIQIEFHDLQNQRSRLILGNPEKIKKEPNPLTSQAFSYNAIKDFFNRTFMVFAMGEPQKPEEEHFEILLQRNLDKPLYQLLQRVFRLPVSYFTYTPQQVLLLKLEDRSIRFEDLGDGAKRAVRILFTAAAAAGGALLLEEPETHQHPRSLQESVRTLLLAAKEWNIQIFATTHSRECLQAFHHEARRQKLGARFYYTRLHEDDELEVISVKPEDMDAFEEMGFDLRYYDEG